MGMKKIIIVAVTVAVFVLLAFIVSPWIYHHSLQQQEIPEFHRFEAKIQDTYNSSNGWERGTVATINDDFSHDEKAVYWLNQYRILDVDPASFHTFFRHYAVDAQGVYMSGYETNGSKRVLYKLDGADVGTFEYLDGWYAKDRFRVFYKGEPIPGVDSRTFQTVSKEYSGYAKDAQWVYENGVKRDDRDATSFRTMGNASYFNIYTADKNGVYLRAQYVGSDGIETRQVEGADPMTFSVIQGFYGRDAKHVFYGRHLVDGADPESFEVLPPHRSSFDNYDYATDSQAVYFTHTKVLGADPKTVRVVDIPMIPFSSFLEGDSSAYIDGKSFPKSDLRRLQQGKLPISARRVSSTCYFWNDDWYHYSPADGASGPLLSKSKIHMKDANCQTE